MGVSSFSHWKVGGGMPILSVQVRVRVEPAVTVWSLAGDITAAGLTVCVCVCVCEQVHVCVHVHVCEQVHGCVHVHVFVCESVQVLSGQHMYTVW